MLDLTHESSRIRARGDCKVTGVLLGIGGDIDVPAIPPTSIPEFQFTSLGNEGFCGCPIVLELTASGLIHWGVISAMR